MDKVKSQIQFEDFWVERLEFVQTSDSVRAIGEGRRFRLGWKYDERDSHGVIVSLRCQVYEEADENDSPWSLDVVIKGRFTVVVEGEETNQDEDSGVEKMLRANTIAILYPYLRNTVSTITLTCNRPPVILPTINTFKLIEEQQQD